MPIDFECPSCRQYLRVGDDTAGKTAKCPSCAAEFQIPRADPFAETTYAEQTPVNPYATPHATESGQATVVGNQVATDGVLDVGQALNLAFENFRAQAGPLILLAIIYFALMMVLSGVPHLIVNRMRPGDLLTNGAIEFFNLVIGVFFGIGINILTLNVLRGGAVRFGDLFAGGDYFTRIIIPSLVLWGITNAVVIAFLPFGPAGKVLAGIVWIAINATFWIIFWPFSYLVIDQDCDLSVALKTASALTSGNRLSFVLLCFLTFIVVFLGIICCFVGAFLAIPIAFLMHTIAYLMVSRQTIYRPGLTV